MSCLSVIDVEVPGVPRVVANPIFMLSPAQELLPGSNLIFEVLEKDADALRSLIGKTKFFVLDATMSSWGELGRLCPCESKHSGLAYLRAQPTLQGVLSIFGKAVSKQ